MRAWAPTGAVALACFVNSGTRLPPHAMGGAGLEPANLLDVNQALYQLS